MDEREFLDWIAGERMAMSAGLDSEDDREIRLMKECDSVLEGLEEPVKNRVRAQLCVIAERLMDEERKAYTQGIKDGVRLTKWVQSQ